MLEKEERIYSLITKRINEIELTKEEWIELDAWINENAANRAKYEEYANPNEFVQGLAKYHEYASTHKHANVSPYDLIRSAEEQFSTKTDSKKDAIQARSIPFRRRWRWTAAAAVIVLISTLCAYFYFAPSKGTDIVLNPSDTELTDKAPARQQATLTLANNRVIDLSNAPSGELAQEDGVNILKKEDGTIAYEGFGSTVNAGLNTIATPRGGYYHVVLEDGTVVWLNAATSLDYPGSYKNAPVRKVVLKGEAFFEVAHNARQPFIVVAGDASVQVLGTSFNIKNYQLDPLNTTLLQGSVVIKEKSNTRILKPGQQAVLAVSGSGFVVSDVEATESIAWKNNVFSFQGANLATVCRELSRWYAVDFVIEPGVGGEAQFEGDFERSITLASLIRQFEEILPNVHFSIERDKVFVRGK